MNRSDDMAGPAIRHLRPELKWLARVLLGLLRGLHELFTLLWSAPFLVALGMPFALWTVGLLVVQQRYPDQTAAAVAAGPALLVALWTILATIWAAIAVFTGRHRHAFAVVLGIVAQFLVATALHQAPSELQASDALTADHP